MKLKSRENMTAIELDLTQLYHVIPVYHNIISLL